MTEKQNKDPLIKKIEDKAPACPLPEDEASSQPDCDQQEEQTEAQADIREELLSDADLWLDEELREEIKQSLPDAEDSSDEEQRQKASWQLYEAILILLIGFTVARFPMLFSTTAHSMVGLYMISYILQMCCFTLVPLYIVTVSMGRPPSDIGYTRPKVKKIILKGIQFGMPLYALNVLLSFLSSLLLPESLLETQTVTQMIYYANNPLELAMVILLLTVLSPIAEETLFRGFLYPPLRQMLGKWKAIVACGLIFAVAHRNLSVLLPLFAGGCGFAWLYARYENIYYCMAAHSVWNMIALLIYFVSELI